MENKGGTAAQPPFWLFSQGSQPREWCRPQEADLPISINVINTIPQACQRLIVYVSLGFVNWPPTLTITLYAKKKAYGGNVTNNIL